MEGGKRRETGKEKKSSKFALVIAYLYAFIQRIKRNRTEYNTHTRARAHKKSNFW